MKRLITNPTLQGAMQSLFSLRCGLVVASSMLGLGWLSVQAETLKLPTPAQAASAVTLPVLGTLILSPAERRQLDAIARLAATGQGGPLPVAGAGYPAARYAYCQKSLESLWQVCQVQIPLPSGPKPLKGNKTPTRLCRQVL